MITTTDAGGALALADSALPGRSDPAPMPRDAAEVVTELHDLLAVAGVSGPFVLVGVALVAAYLLTVVPAKRGTSVLLTVEAVTVALILLIVAVVLVRLLGGSTPDTGTFAGGSFTLDVFTVAPGTDLSAVFLGVVFGFLSFAGFEAAATLGEEARNPRRDGIDDGHPAVQEALADTEDRLNLLLAVDGDRTPDSFHRELGELMWELCGMARSEAPLNAQP